MPHTTKTAPKGKKHWNWKGGKSKWTDGYFCILAPNHPNHFKNAPYVLEHRLVMEKCLGRYLRPWEIVHHKNGIRNDNRIENLELFTIYSHRSRSKPHRPKKIICPKCKYSF